MVEVKKVEYMGWENCYKISNGKIEAVVTTDVGPRIIHFGFEGGKNVFCVVEDQAGKVGGDEENIWWNKTVAQSRSYATLLFS